MANIFTSVFGGIKALFKHGLKTFLMAVFTESKQMLIDKLKNIAVMAVNELATVDISNEEKRKAAFERIKAYAKERGIEAKDSIINLTIELAVQNMKD